MLSNARKQILQFSSLVLQNEFDLDPLSSPDQSIPYSALSGHALDFTLPAGFLYDLVVHTHTDWPAFAKVFTPVIESLVREMRKASLVDPNYKQPISCLKELCEMKVGSARPICNLLVQHVRKKETDLAE